MFWPGLQSVKCFLDSSISCLVFKNVRKRWKMSTTMTSSYVFFSPRSKRYPVYCRLGVKNNHTFKKLEPENCDVSINRLPNCWWFIYWGGILFRFVLSLTEALVLSWVASCLENTRLLSHLALFYDNCWTKSQLHLQTSRKLKRSIGVSWCWWR